MESEYNIRLHDFISFKKEALKYEPNQLKKFYDKWSLGRFIPFELICIYCKSGDGVIFKFDEDKSIVYIFGGVYLVEDYFIEKSYILDLNKEKDIQFNCLNNNFCPDYTDYPHILFSKNLYDTVFL